MQLHKWQDEEYAFIMSIVRVGTKRKGFDIHPRTVVQVIRVAGVISELRVLGTNTGAHVSIHSDPRAFKDSLAALMPADQVCDTDPDLWWPLERRVLTRHLYMLGVDEDMSVALLALRDAGVLPDEGIARYLYRLSNDPEFADTVAFSAHREMLAEVIRAYQP